MGFKDVASPLYLTQRQTPSILLSIFVRGSNGSSTVDFQTNLFAFFIFLYSDPWGILDSGRTKTPCKLVLGA